MRASRLIPVVATALLLGALPARAQSPSATPSATPTPAHRAAVQRLMTVTRVRELTEQSTETMLASQLKQMPQLAPFAGVLREFYREQMSWTVLEPEYTRLYLEVFSEPELRELADFYETPLGQKMLVRMPVLMARSNELAARRIQTALPQLMQRLQAAMQEQAASPPDSARASKP